MRSFGSFWASVDYSTQSTSNDSNIQTNKQNAELFNVESTKTKDQQNGDALMLLKGFLESVAENNDGGGQEKQFCEEEGGEEEMKEGGNAEVNEGGEEEGKLQEEDEQPTTSSNILVASGEEEQQQQQATDELDFFAPLKSLLLSSTLDSAQGSGTSTPSRAAVVDSKAIRKAHCQVCDLDICSTARQRHVYMVHLKKKVIILF
uniref:C2H2-type domain-containing protein n=1 Tax=Meloidogyne floridensis TaxID=298350 RepID=A0A915NIS5_9BILA